MRITNRTGKTLYITYRYDISLLTLTNHKFGVSNLLDDNECVDFAVRTDTMLNINSMNGEVFGIDFLKDEIEIYSETKGMITLTPNNMTMIDVRE